MCPRGSEQAIAHERARKRTDVRSLRGRSRPAPTPSTRAAAPLLRFGGLSRRCRRAASAASARTRTPWRTRSQTWGTTCRSSAKPRRSPGRQDDGRVHGACDLAEVPPAVEARAARCRCPGFAGRSPSIASCAELQPSARSISSCFPTAMARASASRSAPFVPFVVRFGGPASVVQRWDGRRFSTACARASRHGWNARPALRAPDPGLREPARLPTRLRSEWWLDPDAVPDRPESARPGQVPPRRTTDRRATGRARPVRRAPAVVQGRAANSSPRCRSSLSAPPGCPFQLVGNDTRTGPGRQLAAARRSRSALRASGAHDRVPFRDPLPQEELVTAVSRLHGVRPAFAQRRLSERRAGSDGMRTAVRRHQRRGAAELVIREPMRNRRTARRSRAPWRPRSRRSSPCPARRATKWARVARRIVEQACATPVIAAQAVEAYREAIRRFACRIAARQRSAAMSATIAAPGSAARRRHPSCVQRQPGDPQGARERAGAGRAVAHHRGRRRLDRRFRGNRAVLRASRHGDHARRTVACRARATPASRRRRRPTSRCWTRTTSGGPGSSPANSGLIEAHPEVGIVFTDMRLERPDGTVVEDGFLHDDRGVRGARAVAAGGQCVPAARRRWAKRSCASTSSRRRPRCCAARQSPRHRRFRRGIPLLRRRRVLDAPAHALARNRHRGIASCFPSCGRATRR